MKRQKKSELMMIRMPVELHTKIKDAAVKGGTTKAEIMRAAVMLSLPILQEQPQWALAVQFGFVGMDCNPKLVIKDGALLSLGKGGAR